MEGVLASEWEIQKYWTVLLAGMPKGAGKTTFALSSTREDKPTVVIGCDLGRLSIPPGVPRNKVLVLSYQEITRSMGHDGQTAPLKDVYLKLTRDLYAVYQAIKKGTPLDYEIAGTKMQFETPANVVLDGVPRLNNMLVDGQCALNNILDPTDLDNKAFKFWGKRLRSIMTIFEQFASLPCNVFFTTWVDPQKDSEGKPTGVWLPDIGGKMDINGPGTVGAALRCYSRAGKFFVQTKSDGMYPWVGVRDRYDLASDIDVTITKGDQFSPFEKVFGRIQ